MKPSQSRMCAQLDQAIRTLRASMAEADRTGNTSVTDFDLAEVGRLTVECRLELRDGFNSFSADPAQAFGARVRAALVAEVEK